MKRKILFYVLLVLLLTPWPVAYAYDDSTGEETGTIVTTASQEAQPAWTANGDATGTVVPGDLFYIDMTNNGDDSQFILFITNIDQLVNKYSDMTMDTGIYAQGKDGWTKIKPDEYATYDDMYLTMDTGYTCFTLPGNGSYKVSIEKGCFHRDGASNDDSEINPEFYLTRR